MMSFSSPPDTLQQILQEALDQDVEHFRSRTYAESTRKAYNCQTQSYLDFCRFMGYAPVPATSGILCRYAALLARSHKYTSIKQYLNAIRILHLQWEVPNPLENNFSLNCILKGIRRELGDSVSRKLPITPSLLLHILSCLDMNNVTHCFIWAAALVMFYAMLRRSNLLPKSANSFCAKRQLLRKDIQFRKDGLIITIKWSKTIQFQERILNLPLPRFKDHPLCPLQAVYRAFSMTPQLSPEGPALICVSNGKTQPLTVDIFLSVIRAALSTAGCDPGAYAGHSFRRGGATWAHQNGIPIDTIRQIGD